MENLIEALENPKKICFSYDDYYRGSDFFEMRIADDGTAKVVGIRGYGLSTPKQETLEFSAEEVAEFINRLKESGIREWKEDYDPYIMDMDVEGFEWCLDIRHGYSGRTAVYGSNNGPADSQRVLSVFRFPFEAVYGWSDFFAMDLADRPGATKQDMPDQSKPDEDEIDDFDERSAIMGELGFSFGI